MQEKEKIMKKKMKNKRTIFSFFGIIGVRGKAFFSPLSPYTILNL